MSTISLGTVDNGTTIDAVVGDVIVVRLTENPTTGYRWSLESVEGSLLTIEDDTFVLDSGPPMGSGGTRQFRFRTTAAGATTLNLKHWREWAGEDSVTERYTVQVQAVGEVGA